jgi:hypothetical protein
VTDFPEIAKAFTVQKVCVNEAISLPDDLRLSAINRLGNKSSLKLTYCRSYKLSDGPGAKRRCG